MRKKGRKYRFLRRLGRIGLVLAVLFVTVILFIRSPWGQDLIVSRVVRTISDHTKTKVGINRLFITFSGNVYLDGLYLEDRHGDTLVYSRSLEAHIPLYNALFKNQINIRSLSWDGLKAHVSRMENTEAYNFSFLLDAFAAKDTMGKQPASDPMTFTVGWVDLKNIKIDYSDLHTGVGSSLAMGSLYLDMEEFNPDEMRFRLHEARLGNTEVFYEQTLPPVPGKDTLSPVLPYIAIDNLNIHELKATYHSIPDSLRASVQIGSFLLELPKADLAKNTIDIRQFSLKNSSVDVQTASSALSGEDSLNARKAGEISWPGWSITASDIAMEENHFRYRSGNIQKVSGGFQPNDIDLQDFSARITDAAYRPEAVKLKLASLSFREWCGFRLQKASFNLGMDNSGAELSNLSLRTANSSLKGAIGISYDTFRDFLTNPGGNEVKLDLPNFYLDLHDLFFFQPRLARNEYFRKAAKHKVTGNLNMMGTLARAELSKAEIAWGLHTFLNIHGAIGNIARPDSLYFDLSPILAGTTRTDMQPFVPEGAPGVSLPHTIRMEASARGTPTDLQADALLKTREGSVRVAIDYQGEDGKYRGDFRVDTLQLGSLLKNDQLGRLSGILEFSGGGNSLNDLDLDLKSTVSEFEFRKYTFRDLSTEAQIHNGEGNLEMMYKDANLDMGVKAHVRLDSLDSGIGVSLNLAGADLNALGITRENIRAGGTLRANIRGNPDDFTGNVILRDGVAVYDGDQYQLDRVDLGAHVDRTNTDFTIQSDFLTAALRSNTSPEGLIKALKQQFRNYFHKEDPERVGTGSVKLHVNAVIRPTPVLTEVFFRNVKELDSITLMAEYDESEGDLTAELHVPAVNYAGSVIDSLDFSMKGTREDLNFSAGLSNLVFGPVLIGETNFRGTLKNNALEMDFMALNEDKKLLHIGSDMVLEKDTISLHIDPKELILNRQEWSVPGNNLLLMSDRYLGFRNMVLSRGRQKLEVGSTFPGIKSEHIGISFTDFHLQTLLSLLNPEEALVSGQVNGELAIENPYGATGMVAGFTIDSLKVRQKPLGRLSVNATSKDKGRYDFNLALEGRDADLQLNGGYAASKAGARLNLELGIHRLDMQLVEGFSGDAIKESKGIISGKIAVSGTTAAPEYTGKLAFDQVDFKVTSLNARFKLSDQSLRMDTKGIYFDDFSIRDARDKAFSINGSVFTANLLNPSFDLKLAASEFLLLDSGKEDNELFYGSASVDADLDVGGSLRAPELEGRLKIRKVTDVTYVVPESQLDIEERDGVVIFVNREEPDAILTKNEEEAPVMFQGAQIKVVVEIADDAVFHIILDKRTGDNLQVSGDAELNLDVQPNNRVHLSGRYELNSGHYETSLYNLVKRRFEINGGSIISWQGDPADARLDVTATYALETSASPLMTAVTSGQDASVAGKYRQVLPFLVYLNVDGELLQPELSFNLDMPEDARGTLGGAVYSRVQQLNSQEAELNKQVFSLLALNRFFPDSGSDGSGGGTAALARDNVNKVLSGELNAFSDRIFGKSGFELEFDLDSFTDYQGETPKERTQLNINASKKLFDDRLIITAGSAVDVEGSAPSSQEPTPIVGNVSLEYLLTDNGQYRLKGFRKNEFQNIIDGQLIVTGIALIFNREFNKLSELFNPLKDQDQPGSREKETKQGQED